MRRFAVLILGLCGFAAPAFAQFTTVTATVTDPSGIPYAGAVMNAILVPGASGGYTLGGQPYSGRVGPVTLDSTGKFTAQFGDVTLITPGSPQWQITIDSAAATVQAPLGTGPQSFVFTSTGTTISGSSPVSLTSALNALAPKLTNFAVGGTVTTTGTPVANQVAEFSSATAITGNARFTDNGTTLSYTGSGGLSVTGGPSTFNNAAGSGALDIIFGLINRIHGSCGNGSGYRFATNEAGNSDITTNATQGGYNLICPDNLTDTAVGQTEIGSTSKTVVDNFHPGNNWTYNQSAAATYAWGLHNASALVGENIGTQGGSRTGGAYFKIGCLSNLTFGLVNGEYNTGSGQAYGLVDNINLEGCPTGTVGAGSPSTAMFDWEAISGVNEIRNPFVFGFANTIGIRLAANALASSAEGPLACINCWSNGGSNAGAQPWALETTGTRPMLPIGIIGGAGLDPGATQTIFNINGHGNSYGSGSTFFGGNITGMYTENLNVGSASTHFNLVDTSNWHFSGDGGLMGSSNTDTYFNINQTVSGLTCNITIENVRAQSGGTLINNVITGFTQASLGSANWISFYHHGGISHGCNVTPLTIDNNKLQILNTTGVAELIKNNADSELDSDLDCGTTAVQSCYHRYLDRGTVEWEEGKASNIYRVTDVVNNQVHFAGVQASQTFVSGFGAGPVELNESTGSSGLVDFWNAGGTIKTGEVDASGNIFFGCHTTTFQNCTELTAPNAAGGASAAVMTWPATGGTVMVTGQNSAQKTQRFGGSCTTAASAAATCTSTFSWTTAFADANYTPVCWGEGPAGSPIISLNATQVAASVTVQVQAATAVASSFAGVYCHATHD